jgi:hypothetical protein
MKPISSQPKRRRILVISLRAARCALLEVGLQPLSEAEAAAIVGARLLATRADEQRGLRFCS